MSEQGYPIQKLSEAILVLVTHEGRIRERLCASMPKFAGFNPKVFSEGVQTQHQEIFEQLTTVSQEDAGDRGSFCASIDAMSEQEASIVAGQLMALSHTAVREYNGGTY